MRLSLTATLLAGLIATGLPAPALAQDFDAVKAQLDEVEKQIPELKVGDGKTANALIKKINAAKANLNMCDRKAPSYAELGARSMELDAWIRAQAQGQARPAQEDHLGAAKAELDSVEKDVAALSPGDVAATNAIVQRINGVRTRLSKVVNRSAPAFGEQAARADALDKQARARFAEGQGRASGHCRRGREAAAGGPGQGPGDERQVRLHQRVRARIPRGRRAGERLGPQGVGG